MPIFFKWEYFHIFFICSTIRLYATERITASLHSYRTEREFSWFFMIVQVVLLRVNWRGSRSFHSFNNTFLTWNLRESVIIENPECLPPFLLLFCHYYYIIVISLNLHCESQTERDPTTHTLVSLSAFTTKILNWKFRTYITNFLVYSYCVESFKL